MRVSTLPSGVAPISAPYGSSQVSRGPFGRSAFENRVILGTLGGGPYTGGPGDLSAALQYGFTAAMMEVPPGANMPALSPLLRAWIDKVRSHYLEAILCLTDRASDNTSKLLTHIEYCRNELGVGVICVRTSRALTEIQALSSGMEWADGGSDHCRLLLVDAGMPRATREPVAMAAYAGAHFQHPFLFPEGPSLWCATELCIASPISEAGSRFDAVELSMHARLALAMHMLLPSAPIITFRGDSFSHFQADPALSSYWHELVAVRQRTLLSPQACACSADEDSDAILVRYSGGSDSFIVLLNLGDVDAQVILSMPRGFWRKTLDSAEEAWGGVGSITRAELFSSGKVRLNLRARTAYVFEEITRA